MLSLIITGYKSSAQTDLVFWTFPVISTNVANGGIAANAAKVISTNVTGAVAYPTGAGGTGDFSLSYQGWDAGINTKYWEIEFNTIGYQNILLSSKQKSSATGPKDFKAQYRIGTTGIWTDISGGIVTVANDWLGALSNVSLPIEADNQVSVFIRWIMTSNVSVGLGVTAAGGTSRMDDLYIKGTSISTDAEILTFDIPTQISSTINSLAGTVDIIMPLGTNLTSLTPTITISTGASISPLSGAVQNFTSSVSYTVTANDGITTKPWSVSVTTELASNAAEIITFDIPTQTLNTINSGLATVNIIVPIGTNVTALIPSISVSAGATVSPTTGVANDFTNPVNYIVTAEDGSHKDWTVTVVLQQSSLAEILTFNIPSQSLSTINSTAATVDIEMPFGTNVTALIPAITVSAGATIAPANGIATDFTNPVIYTVTAEDGTNKTWTVTVTLLPGSTAAEIITFDLPSQTSSVVNIGSATVDIVMPTGSIVTNIIPTITISTNATILPNTGVSHDFSTPSVYVVTSENGITKNWTITVTVAQASLVEWTFPNNPDDNIADGGITANLTKVITTNSTGTVTYVPASGTTTSAIRTDGWYNGMDSKYFEIEFTTGGYKDITLSSKLRSSNTGPRDFKAQYRIGLSGTWTDIATLLVANNFTSGVLADIALPSACNNQNSLYVRWIMTSNLSVRAGTSTYSPTDSVPTTGVSNMDDIYVKGTPFISSDAEIISFDILTQFSSTITSGTGTVDIVMPFGTNLNGLTPAIVISSGATISPLTGVSQNFTSQVSYTVTAADGTPKIWNVNVTVEPVNSAAEITAFDIPSQYSSVINSLTDTIIITMPFGTNVTNLTPSIATSIGATVIPNSGISQDFTLPVVYTVTAENGVTNKDWTVILDFLSSVETTYNNTEIILFPNPANDEVNLIFKDKSASNINVELISFDGKVLFNNKLFNNTISLTNLSSGIYFVKVISNEKTIMKKLIKN
jgi:hypothetical protein